MNSNKRNTKRGQSKVIVILSLEGMLILTCKKCLQPVICLLVDGCLELNTQLSFQSMPNQKGY